MRGCNETVSGGAGMTNAISVKDRLKKQAIEDGKTMQDNKMNDEHKLQLKIKNEKFIDKL
jgi:hypothetical protein